jgi:hypothetical protein
MPVHIEELSMQVDVVDPTALLSPAVMERLVAAVVASIEAQQRQAESRKAEQRVRSVVEQQRARWGG